MCYSVEIDKNINALAWCFQKLSESIDSYEWDVSINTGGIDYGIYFNFDLDRKEVEISNQPGIGYNEDLDLDEILEKINPEGDD